MYRRSAVDELVNPNLKNDFAHDFSVCGFGAKSVAKAFSSPTNVSARRECCQDLFKLESLLRRIPFNITIFAIHSMHVLEDHRSRMRERGGEGWKCAMTIPWLFSAIFTLSKISIERR